MKYPNGFKGVSNILTAEILGLISALAFILSLLVMGAGVAAGSADVAVGGLLATLLSVVLGTILGLVALVVSLIGINAAKNDEPATKFFTYAFYATIINLIFGVIAGFALPSDSIVKTVISDILNTVVTVFIIMGIQSFARELGNTELESLGKTILICIVIVQVISIVISIIGANVTTTVFSIIGGVLTVVYYVIYLVFLSKAKTMLKAQ